MAFLSSAGSFISKSSEVTACGGFLEVLRQVRTCIEEAFHHEAVAYRPRLHLPPRFLHFRCFAVMDISFSPIGFVVVVRAMMDGGRKEEQGEVVASR